MIIDHNRNPRNHHDMADATSQANGFNTLCGDKLTVYVKIEDNKITDLSFLGQGCAISQASASLMTEALRGKTLQEAHDLFSRFHNMLTIDEDINPIRFGEITGTCRSEGLSRRGLNVRLWLGILWKQRLIKKRHWLVRSD